MTQSDPSPNLTIVRRIHFCAGHRLFQHGGKCENLHGHNYVTEIAVSARQTDAVGRIVDFAELKRLFKGWIDEQWDHGFIIYRGDTQAIQAIRSVDPHKLYLLPDNPTAENLARHLLTEIGPQLLGELTGYDLRLRRVTVWETQDAWAEVSADPQA
jgi:6-pyruvoyltetrahydropterin/6-carboxytetrahydropterin synthase